MKVRFLADANFVIHIVTGLIRREPQIDFQTADEAGLAEKTDEQVLQIAASAGRVLVTHDRRSMLAHFARFILTQAIDELLLVWSASEAEEWTNIISALPF